MAEEEADIFFAYCKQVMLAFVVFTFIDSEEEKGKPQQVKRPSHKYRKRPRNLLTDYWNRQRKPRLLETHIWGYRSPCASCDKTYRACYRASTEYCLLQDMSFYPCIEKSL
uniref:Pop1 N-terminal domain-containing protein n=1 Tax=Glossina pallidipes TaxID=7398 RepID=A0A1A9ZGM1_GLOPL